MQVWVSRLVIALLLLIWGGVVCLPGTIAFRSMWMPSPDAVTQLHASALWSTRFVLTHLLGTLGWGVVISVSASIIAIPVGFALGSAPSGSTYNRMFRTVCVVSLCLPAFIGYWAWGMLRLPGSWLGDFIAQGSREQADLMGMLQLWLGLTLWVWPVPAMTLAAALQRVPRSRQEALQLDAVHRIRQSLIILRECTSGLWLGLLLAFLATISAAVVFDLASTQTAGASTYSELLRRIYGQTGSNEAILVASRPLVIAGLMLALFVWWILNRPPNDIQHHAIRSSPFLRFVACLLPMVAIGLPVAILILKMESLRAFRELTATDGRSVLTGVWLVVITAFIMTLVAIMLAFGWMRARASAPWAWGLTCISISWLWVSLLPATTIGAMIVLTLNSPPILFVRETLHMEWIYTTPVANVMGYLARFGFVPILAGRWFAATHARPVQDMRCLDGVHEFPDWLRAVGPGMLLTCACTGIVGGLLSLSEISTTVIVTPPGYQSPAERLLNRLHYAREDAAIAMVILLMATVFVLGFVTVFIGQTALSSTAMDASQPKSKRRRLYSITIWFIAWSCAAVSIPGCDDTRDSTNDSKATVSERLPHQIEIEKSFGSTGIQNGQFNYARAIAADPLRKIVYVVDRTGRIQSFDIDGIHLQTWWMPTYERGYPTGISVHPQTGDVYLADTHNQRVLVYTPQGEIKREIGEYGLGPGQFIYVSDIAFGPNDELFISETGGNDRIQVFNEEGKYLYEFGKPGREKLEEFTRPQSLYIDHDADELWIADSCNHRLVVTDLQGNVKRTVGSYGTAEGTWCYPYGILALPDDTLLIAEFGNSRFQRLQKDGTFVGRYGAYGDAPGMFSSPWSAARIGSRVYLLDSHNNRIQIVDYRALEKANDG